MLAALFAVALAPSTVFGQQARVAVDVGPHYAGEPVTIQIVAEGFQGESQPVCQPSEPPAGVTITPAGKRSNRSSNISIVNGRMTRRVQTVFYFNFQVTAGEPGAVMIASFVVSQDKRQATTAPFELVLRRMEIDDSMRVAIVMPGGSIYPEQRVPVRIEWSYAGELNDLDYRSLQIRSPLFDRFDFEDDPPDQGDSTLPIQTAKGPVGLKAEAARRTLGGRTFVVVTAHRTMTAREPGRYELAPITATVPRVTRWQTDPFGSRRPVRSRRIRAVGKPLELHVKPLPLQDAPPQFAGAIGSGFGIEVSADRSVVRVGDPIELSITLRGAGNLERAGLPPLAAATSAQANATGRLDPAMFRVPTEDLSGELLEDGKAKRFVVSVRVVDEKAARIPALTYAWFDPQAGSFETAQSAPISLTVDKGDSVGAADVVAAPPKAADPDGRRPAGATTGATPNAAPQTAPMDLTGADLAIEVDAARLLADQTYGYGGPALRRSLYVASCFLVAAAWLRRRAADVAPARRERRRSIKAHLRQIEDAVGLPRREAAGLIAQALRQMAQLSNGQQQAPIDDLLQECDGLTYTPGDDASQSIDADLHRRAVDAARSIAKQQA